jgi:hypothetical protein
MAGRRQVKLNRRHHSPASPHPLDPGPGRLQALDEKDPLPERNSHIWQLGRSPKYHLCGSPVRERRLSSTLRAQEEQP